MTMLTTMGLSFLLLLAVIAAMAIGVLLGGKRIRGSCGGVAGGGCELCGKDTGPPPARGT